MPPSAPHATVTAMRHNTANCGVATSNAHPKNMAAIAVRKGEFIKQAQTAFDFFSRAINRLDEIDMGRDLLVKHVKGKNPVLNEENGIFATGAAVHKDVDSYVKVIGMLAKMYAATPRIDAALKKKRVFDLFEKGLDVKLNTITEKISRSDYLEQFDKALAGKTLEFDRFEIDPNTVRHLKALDDFEAVMDKCGAVLDGLSIVLIFAKAKEQRSKEDVYNFMKSAASVALYVGKLKKVANSGFGIAAKKVTPYSTIVFSICDATFCGIKSYDELKTDDLDASLAKATSVVGNLLTATGTILLFFPPAAPIGLAGIAVGAVLTTGGELWHSFADDNEITFFLKRSPWGIDGLESQSINSLQQNRDDYIKYLQRAISNA